MSRLAETRELFGRHPQISDETELLSIILGNTKGRDSYDVAKEIVDTFMPSRNEYQLADDMDYHDLMKIRGVGEAGAMRVCAAIRLGRKLANKAYKNRLPYLNEDRAVYEYFKELKYETQEHFLAAYVNTKLKLLGYKEISKGNISTAPVDVKEVMKWAIRYNAVGIILVHNHPSGNPEPSKEDIDITERISVAAQYMDTEVYDHVIIGDGSYVSLRDRGII